MLPFHGINEIKEISIHDILRQIIGKNHRMQKILLLVKTTEYWKLCQKKFCVILCDSVWFCGFSKHPFIMTIIHTRVCVMIEFSSIGVQTMFLAYIGGLFWIQSENENESTSPKKIKNKYNSFFYRFGYFFYFFKIFHNFLWLVLSFSFSDWIQKSPQI